jgi:hypothetical protein
MKRVKNRKLPNKFLILSVSSIVGFFLFVFFHNATSGILSLVFNKNIEEPVFFILATIVCPLGLLIGIIGGLVQLIKKVRK